MLKTGGGIPHDLTATSNKALYNKTFIGANGERYSGTIPLVAAQVITPGTSDKQIPSGRYLSGNQVIKGDANLIASNIRSGVTIFGVGGTL